MDKKGWEMIHHELGCDNCFYADPEKVNKEPCCTYPGKVWPKENGICAKLQIILGKDSKPVIREEG